MLLRLDCNVGDKYIICHIFKNSLKKKKSGKTTECASVLLLIMQGALGRHLRKGNL